MRDGYVVVDAHAHIELHERVVFGGRTAQITTEQLIAQMDAYGIDAAWVIAHAWAGWQIDDYRREHDAIAREIAAHPRRLIGFCWADPLLGKDAVDELKRCVLELGYRGLKLHPVYQRFVFDGPSVRPLVETARELGIPITAHLDLRVPGCEPWRMVELARAYPDVSFVLAHSGRDVRALQDLSFAEAASDVPNMLLEGSSSATDSYGTFAGPAEILGAERVLFASDSGAFHHPAVNLLKLDLLEMDSEAKARIFGLNALQLVGLTPDDVDRAPDRARGTFETAVGSVAYPVPATAIQPRFGRDA